MIGPDATTKAIDPGSWEPDVYGEVESPFKLDQGKELQNLKRRTKHLAYGLVGVGVIELVLILTHLGFSPLKEDLEKIKAILQTLFKPEGLRCGNCDKPSLRASAFLEEVRFRQDDVAKALDLEDGSSTINAKMGVQSSLLDGAFIPSRCSCVSIARRFWSGHEQFEALVCSKRLSLPSWLNMIRAVLAFHSQHLTFRTAVAEPVSGLFSPFWRIFDLLS